MNDVFRVDETTITTRRRARELAAEADSRDVAAIDLGDVEFVSRSVADELVHQAREHSFDLHGAEADVATMIDAIRGSEQAMA
jgi:anti-anti-sigma regulatory factor